jgi:hypothetical protein
VEHLVRFSTTEGREGHHYASDLDDALKFVERLRNTEEASEVRVYHLRQVPIEFRAYYRVEVKAGEAEAPAEADAAAAATPAPVAAPSGSSLIAELPAAEALVAPGTPIMPPAPAGPENENGSGRRLFARG